ncbi:MAG: plasmid mobilization relaxosome protein MobC [Planctomycetota bacterium]
MTQPRKKTDPRDNRPHRLGRPRKPADDLRTRRAQLRLTEAEKQRLAENAAKAGLAEAEYLRKLILGHKPRGVAAADPQLLFELNAIGNNLNQAVRDAHAGRSSEHDWQALRHQLRSVLARAAQACVR